MGKKVRGIRLFTDRTFEERRFLTDRNKIRYGKGKKTETTYEPACVFKERRTWSKAKFWKQPRHLIFFVNEALKALIFGKEIDEIASMWTQNEIKELVKKQMAKSLTEHKPMKWSQFFILLGANVVTLIAVLYLLSRLRVF